MAYGGGSGLYNLILYKLGYLECIGKDSGNLYPGEIDDSDYFFKYYASLVIYTHFNHMNINVSF